jgi:hypothetical protein
VCVCVCVCVCVNASTEYRNLRYQEFCYCGMKYESIFGLHSAFIIEQSSTELLCLQTPLLLYLYNIIMIN